ncbi:MAG: DUF262 domain-containing protein [Turneriella sp.]|nr:DUF262 domain-containing protein [Turneriella sp.]
MDSLDQEINQARQEIKTEAYSMSLGELGNLYKEKEIDVHPEFQRYFRWSNLQKSKLIESILLGIPIPPIFVHQRADGKWDVVDGVQRLSTVFQFMGILLDQEDKLAERLILEGTKALPALEGRYWGEDEKDPISLTPTQKLIIRRSKFDLIILLRETDARTKFELFQRLNTGGSSLTPQEVRNAMLSLRDRDFFSELKTFAKTEGFLETTMLGDKLIAEQFDIELICRFLSLYNLAEADFHLVTDLHDFLDGWTYNIQANSLTSMQKDIEILKKTFEFCFAELGANAFKKYDNETGLYRGGLSIAGFEGVAFGVGFNLLQNTLDLSNFKDKVKALWQNDDFTKNIGAGIRASTRIPNVLRAARKHFAK